MCGVVVVVGGGIEVFVEEASVAAQWHRPLFSSGAGGAGRGVAFNSVPFFARILHFFQAGCVSVPRETQNGVFCFFIISDVPSLSYLAETVLIQRFN